MSPWQTCILGSLVGVYLHLFLVLICMSLITKETEHLFLCSLATWISSFVKCFSQFLPIFPLVSSVGQLGCPTAIFVLDESVATHMEF